MKSEKKTEVLSKKEEKKERIFIIRMQDKRHKDIKII